MMINNIVAGLGFSPVYILYIALGFAVAAMALIATLIVLKYKKQRDHINRRILPLQEEVTPQNAVYLLRKEGDGSGGFALSAPGIWLDKLIMNAGKTISTSRFVSMMGAAMVVILAGSLMLGLSIIVALPLAAFGGLGVPVLSLKYLKSRRIKKFAIQFTEAIELIVRSLKAGHPVPTAIKMVAREMPDPISTEFGMIADEVSYGSDLVTAIKAMQDRVDYEDLPLFVTAISIQSITGGNLSGILEGLATVLRGRVKLRRKVKAAAAEGRASAMILNSVPICVMAFISIFTPEYYGDIIHEEFIIIGLALTFGWMMIGNFAMYKMMNFKV